MQVCNAELVSASDPFSAVLEQGLEQIECKPHMNEALFVGFLPPMLKVPWTKEILLAILTELWVLCSSHVGRDLSNSSAEHASATADEVM